MVYTALALLSANPLSAQERGDTIPVPHALQIAYARATRNPSGSPGRHYWQLWPEYELEARLDPHSATVYGNGILTFTNPAPAPLLEIVLRLDQNRFRAGQSQDVVTRGIEIRQLSINGEELDLASPRVSGRGTTVVRIALPAPLQPRERVVVGYRWDYDVPLDERRLALRQGRWGNTVFQIAQWYPRLAMYDDLEGWDVTPHDGTWEFYNPFGRFRVALHVPANWLVGATGRLTNGEEVLGPVALSRLKAVAHSDTTLLIAGAEERGSAILRRDAGEATWRFEADSVSDFAWGASSEYAWAITSRTLSDGRVLIHALMTHQSRETPAVASAAAARIIGQLSTRIMPYAWDTHTLLGGPEGGMEYPSLTMSNGDERLPHEIAHQWFPMMVGSDETRFDFLDEGFATFFALLADNRPLSGRPPQPAAPPLVVASNLRTPRPVIGYGRGSKMLQTLAADFGEERLLAALRSYAAQWRFKHPSPWDFMASVEASLAVDLDAFWLRWLFRSDAIQPSR